MQRASSAGKTVKSMTPPITAIPQACETPLQRKRVGPFVVAYAYARSADSRGDHSGQDYLAYAVDEHQLAFALCDGVGQSFYGDLAARILGDALVRRLWARPADVHQGETFDIDLDRILEQLTTAASAAVSAQALPAAAPPMLREVLEAQRARGSESMFVCGRLDLAATAGPPGRMALAWLGDSRLRVWRSTIELADELGHSPCAEERWSSRGGVIGGRVHHWLSTLDTADEDVTVMAYSDGLSELDDHELPHIEGRVAAVVAERGDSLDDDASFIRISLGRQAGG